MDVPGATSTYVFGGNDQGDASGAWIDVSGNYHGFVLSQGEFHVVDAPYGGDFTEVGPINERGEFAGDACCALGDLQYGFVHSASMFSVQNAPGARHRLSPFTRRDPLIDFSQLRSFIGIDAFARL